MLLPSESTLGVWRVGTCAQCPQCSQWPSAENTKLVLYVVDADVELIQGLAILEPEGLELIQGLIASLNLRVLNSRRSVFAFSWHTQSTPACIALMESLVILVVALEVVLPCFSGGTPFRDGLRVVGLNIHHHPEAPCLRYAT